MVKSPDWIIVSAHAKDVHGTLGIIAVAFIQSGEESATVENFIMSCRAMGRGIETAMMNQIKMEVFDGKKVKQMFGKFLPSKKNMPASRFYVDQGFEEWPESVPGERLFRLQAKSAITVRTPGIDVRWMKRRNGF